MPGTPSAETLRRFIPAAELFPPRRGTAWQTHFAFDAWGGDKDSWLMPATIDKYFGPPTDLDDLVHKSQLLQSIGYQVVFEEIRRQKPRAAMALNWAFNEPLALRRQQQPHRLAGRTKTGACGGHGGLAARAGQRPHPAV